MSDFLNGNGSDGATSSPSTDEFNAQCILNGVSIQDLSDDVIGEEDDKHLGTLCILPEDFDADAYLLHVTAALDMNEDNENASYLAEEDDDDNSENESHEQQIHDVYDSEK